MKMNEGKAEPVIAKGPRLGIRHVQVVLLFINIAGLCISRMNVSVAVVAMTNAATTNPDFPEFDWSEKEKSYIISSFYWGYVITQFPAGYLNRLFGAKVVMMVCTFFTAIFSLLTPYLVTIGSWQAYCAIRVIQGLLMGSLIPSINDHIAKWSPPQERYLLGALAYSGVNCGAVFAMLVSGLIASSMFGWPGISYISGGICLAWCILWWMFAAKNPPSSPYITQEECKYIESSMNREDDFHKKRIPIPWLAMFTSIPFLALIVVRCSEAWSFSTLQTQIPSYMNGVLNMKIKSNAFFSALPYIARWIMSYAYAFFGIMAVERGWLSLTMMRKIANTMAMWIPALLLIGIGFLDDNNTALAVLLLVVSVGFEAGTATGCELSTIDLAPNHVGVLMGITNPIASVLSLVSPLIVGVVVTDVKNRSEWQIVFGIAALIGFFGNLVYIIFGSSEAQPWDAPDFLRKNNIEESVNDTVDKKSTFEEIFGSRNTEEVTKECRLGNIESERPNVLNKRD